MAAAVIPNIAAMAAADTSALYEGCGEEGPLRGVFFSEFHPIQGPIIRCQLPANDQLITRDVFDAISVYVIPKQPLAGRMITVNALGFKVLGYPVLLEDKKYPRNQFMFNVCFVCYPWSKTVQYEPALKKLTDYLVHLEQEQQYLSREENNVELLAVLNKILQDLNSKKECTVIVENYSIQLKVIRNQEYPPPIRDHDVPVLMVSGLTNETRCDLTTQQITPYIDGVNHVAAISNLSGVEANLVKLCVQNLCYHGVVKVIPIFQYSNVYCVTPNINRLKQQPLRAQFLEFASADPDKPVTFMQAFRFVAALTHGTTVNDLCVRFHIGQELKLDPMRLIQFLVLRGIIRRIHNYPYVEPGKRELESSTPKNIQRLFNGQRTYDEICCITGISASMLDKYVESDTSVKLFRK